MLSNAGFGRLYGSIARGMGGDPYLATDIRNECIKMFMGDAWLRGCIAIGKVVG